MKKLYSLILITVFLMLSLGAISQPPPPPGDPSTSPTGNAPVGQANAPIGNGTLILFLLAAAYGGRKVYVLHSQPEVQ